MSFHMKRLVQSVLVVSTVAFSALAMMVIHELGHVLNGWLSGGTVSRVYLHPFDFSRTELSHNPHPLFVAWGGAVWGCIIPLLLLALARFARWSFWYLAAFFAGFCLVANGAYLGGGSVIVAADAKDLLASGAARWQLILFGLPCVSLGLWLWHGLGVYFGLGAARGQVDRRAAFGVATALLVLVVLELFVSG
jgi:hypothetical protein